MDTHTTVTDTEEATGVILDTDGATLDTGAADGATLDTTDLTTGTITTLTTTEEEDLHLIMEVETMPTETTIPTEATAAIETIPQIEIITPTEVVTPRTDKMATLTLEEAHLQTDEHTIRLAQLLQTEGAILKVKAITATTILTEDQVVQQPEVTTAATLHQEATHLALHVQ